MTHMSKTILFFGTDDFSAPTLTALTEAGYRIGAVITKPDSRAGRGHKLTPPVVKQIALKHHIAVWQPERLADIATNITALQPVTGVLVSYGKIIPQEILDLFSPGIINLHPSLLPSYRGPSPIEAAILNGDTKTGVSIMKLSAAMDAGPIYKAFEYDLLGNETAPQLYDRLAHFGASKLVGLIDDIMGDELPAYEQSDHASYTNLLRKSDGILDPTSLSAEQAERRVRAFLDYPKSRLILSDLTVIVTKAYASDTKTDGLSVVCQDGRYLIIDELVAPSGRKMSGHDFQNGYAAGA